MSRQSTGKIHPLPWRPVLRRGAALLVPALLAGCAMVGPNFERPPTPEVKAWLEANSPNPSANSGLTSRSAPVVAWWETFGDPTLDGLVRQAYAQNLTLQIAGARVYQARAQLGIASGELFPQSQSVGAAVTHRKVSENLSFVQDIDRFTDLDLNFATSEVGFDATWEIDAWGGIRRNIQSARANLAAQVANYDDALVTLTGDVAAVYIDIRALQELLAVARRNIELQEKSLEVTKVRYDDGVTTELDVQEATALLNNTRSLVPSLESDLQQAKNALAVLLAEPSSRMAGAVGSSGRIPVVRTDVTVGIPAELLRRRPDIRAAEMEAAAQADQIGVAMTALYPQFILAGTIGVQATSTSDLFQPSSVASVVTPGISWNVLNYGRLRNNVRAQDAAFQALVANYQNTVMSAYGEVENAMVAYKDAKAQVGFLQQSVDAADRAAEIGLQQYQDGVADYSRVLNTQQASLLAQTKLVEARSSVSGNLVALYKALGGGWQIRKDKGYLPETVVAEMAYRTDWGDLLSNGSGRPVAN